MAVWKSKFDGVFVLNHRESSTPSTRRLLDGVAMPFPRRSTEPGKVASSPRNDLVKYCRVHPTHWTISTPRSVAGARKR